MQAHAKLTGIGCFAGPQTLARVLRRVLGDCLAVPPEQLPAGGGTGERWLRQLFEGRRPPQEQAPIRGFFIGLGPQGLRLSVFTGRPGADCRRHTAPLAQLDAWRRRRLH